MAEVIVNNPFVVGKYLSDKYFCDRETETEFLRKQVENGRNVALISPRRLGKSGLIRHLFNQHDIREHYYVFFVDIYATSSLAVSPDWILDLVISIRQRPHSMRYSIILPKPTSLVSLPSMSSSRFKRMQRKTWRHFYALRSSNARLLSLSLQAASAT